MKVVLFCGGLGLRLREHSETVPKPMVPIAARPVLWYVMKYYAHYGHKEFILCLGHQSATIKNYFRDYDETLTNDFVLENGKVELLGSDASDWKITFVDTGLKSNIGERLLKARPFLGDDEMFLANYADVLTDCPLDRITDQMQDPNTVASMLCVHPNYSFHVVEWAEGSDTRVKAMGDIHASDTWINGGYFAFRSSLFDYLKPGEELVSEPFRRLAEQGGLAGVKHRGFWAPMDTLKEKLQLEAMYESGERPWCVWERPR